MKRRGFSLVELLVVIGIITILLGLLLPVLTRVREKVRLVQCHNNLRQIYTLYEAYSNDNKQKFADIKALGQAPYRRGAGVIDPATGLPETLGLPALLAGKGMPGRGSIWMCPAMPDVYLPSSGDPVNFRAYENTYAWSVTSINPKVDPNDGINVSPRWRNAVSWRPTTGTWAGTYIPELLVSDNFNQRVAAPVADPKDAKKPLPSAFLPQLKVHRTPNRKLALNMLLLDGSVGLW